MPLPLEEPQIRKATLADVPALIEVLSRAFATDPFADWLLRKDARRAEGFRRLYDISLKRLTLPHDEVYTTTRLEGAALWAPPGRWRLNLLSELLLLPHFAAACGTSRLIDVFRGTNAVLRRHPRTPHYYLFVLGVDPACQGRGIGHALLRPMLERCDRERAAAYLETSTERNLPFYRSCGFELKEEIQIPCGGPKSWLMWRDPR